MFRVKNRFAIDQDYMAPHAEKWSSLRRIHSIMKCPAIGHQRGRGNDSASMSFDDGAIDARSESEIIGIDDQAPHAVSLAGRVWVNEGFAGANTIFTRFRRNAR